MCNIQTVFSMHHTDVVVCFMGFSHLQWQALSFSNQDDTHETQLLQIDMADCPTFCKVQKCKDHPEFCEQSVSFGVDSHSNLSGQCIMNVHIWNTQLQFWRQVYAIDHSDENHSFSLSSPFPTQIPKFLALLHSPCYYRWFAVMMISTYYSCF
jgi:hypothetical protein